MSLTVVRQTKSKIIFDTGEWFDPTQAKSYPDEMASTPRNEHDSTWTEVALWQTETGQWLSHYKRHNAVSFYLDETDYWEKLNKKEAAARLIVNGYEEPEGVDYNYLKV